MVRGTRSTSKVENCIGLQKGYGTMPARRIFAPISKLQGPSLNYREDIEPFSTGACRTDDLETGSCQRQLLDDRGDHRAEKTVNRAI